MSSMWNYKNMSEKNINNGTNYRKINNKMIIICHIHGEFKQLPCNHLNCEKACKNCGTKKAPIKIISKTEKFIKKAGLVHKNYYDYSLTTYGLNNKELLIIICPN